MAGPNNTWNNETTVTLQAFAKEVNDLLGQVLAERARGDFEGLTEPLCVGAFGWQAKIKTGLAAIHDAVSAAVTKAKRAKDAGQPYSGACDTKKGLLPPGVELPSTLPINKARKPKNKKA